MRRLAPAVLLLLLLLLAACGGGSAKKSAPPPSPSAPSDPGRAAVAALFRAAAHDDRRALWNLISTRSQQRLGGGYAAFVRAGAAELERRLAPFGTASPVPFVSQGLSEQFGVVAIRRGTSALAFTVRNQHGVTKIELSSPLAFQILGPAPGSTGSVRQVAVHVRSSGVVDDAVVWLDGQAVRPTLATARGKATVFVAFAKPLPKGLHVAVVYAEEGNDANAEAWSFTAR